MTHQQPPYGPLGSLKNELDKRQSYCCLFSTYHPTLSKSTPHRPSVLGTDDGATVEPEVIDVDALGLVEMLEAVCVEAEDVDTIFDDVGEGDGESGPSRQPFWQPLTLRQLRLN